MSVLRQYHAELGRIIIAHDGTIEHFAGDGMMILFNAPVPVENHELQAIRMTLAMREALTALSVSWRKRGHELGFGVGIAGGYATIGTIGFEQRLDYGAVGPACNLAARLCGEAKDTQILVAQRVFAKVETSIEAEPIGDLVLKGFHRPVPAYNILGMRLDGLGPSRRRRRGRTAAVDRLIPSCLVHELCQFRYVCDFEVAAFAPEQTDRGEPAELPRDCLPVRADAVGNVRKRGRRGKHDLGLPATCFARQTQQFCMYAILNDKRAELEYALR